jgi:hypothetical protein
VIGTMGRTLAAAIAACTIVLGPAAAADKSTLFDLDKDLALFFKAQAEIQATDPGREDTASELAAKKAKRAELFRKYGIRDEKHWVKEGHAGMGYSFTKRAERIYGGREAVLDMRRAAGQGMNLQEYRAHERQMKEVSEQALERMKLLHDESAFDAALLAPIDGVSLEKYAAAANAAMFHDDDFAAVAKETGITEKRFEALTEKWTERMRSDPTRILMNKYGGHLMAATRGRFAEAGKNLGRSMIERGPLSGPEPIPFEQWVEITEYYASKSGEIKAPADVTRVLQPYGLTFYEWNIASNWWGRKRTRAMEGDDPQFVSRWMALREKYRLKFASAGR